MRSTIARGVLFPWKMRQEIAETKLASVSYANRRKRSVSNGVTEREVDGLGVPEREGERRFLQKRRDRTRRDEMKRNETTGPDEGQCQVLEIPWNGWQPRASKNLSEQSNVSPSTLYLRLKVVHLPRKIFLIFPHFLSQFYRTLNL